MGNEQSNRRRVEGESIEEAPTSSISQSKRKVEGESIEEASTSFISPVLTGQGDDQYDVFLSFRGSDTRKEFIDHLYHRLVNGGIRISVFKDDNSIPIGEEFGPQILGAISRSKISIPIISKNYAKSTWCLRELIHMMDCKKNMSHIVLPIFYKVDPSDVRYQKGSFGEAFHSRKRHFGENDIQKAAQALREVSHLHGWESEKVANGHEGELIERVVKTVMSKLSENFQLDIPEQLVGLDGPLKEIMTWIHSPSERARMIGIYGMGGIGKTTLAKCIYNQLRDKFVHLSYLPDIGEKATQKDGIMSLQSQLISDVLRSEHKVSRVDDGINIMKSRFKEKKVLIVLDNIDDKKQLDLLARKHSWFMSGSIIIVTTRNEAILDQSEFEVDYKYRLKELDEVHSLLLFNRHAFRMDYSQKDFESISHNIISTMGGLPLALQVVGSYLFRKMNRKVWEDVRKQLENQPYRDVQKILQISYNALEDAHKQIFLDIACNLINENSKYAIYMWEDSGLNPNQGIEELKLRCLIKIGDNDEFKMHDQLRDLGRSISCEGLPLEVRHQPWLFIYRGVPKVLSTKYHWIFELTWSASSGDSQLLSEVRWLECAVFLSGTDFSVPRLTNLNLPKLSVLDLRVSDIQENWEGWRSIETAKGLKVLDISYCNKLRCTPDLSTFTQLKILKLSSCWALEHLHPSIGNLRSLISLDLSICVCLKELHPSIGNLRSLISLDLSLCKCLKELPEQVGKLKELEELLLDGTGITEIPTSIGSLRKLKKLSATCQSLRKIPNSIGDLQNLQHLDLNGTLISDLPESIVNLSSLQWLSLWDCGELPLLPKLPLGLKYLSITCQCTRLPQLSSLIGLEELRLVACNLLEEIPETASGLLKLCVAKCDKLILLKLDGFKCLQELSLTKCRSIERLDISQLNHLKRFCAEECHSLADIQT